MELLRWPLNTSGLFLQYKDTNIVVSYNQWKPRIGAVFFPRQGSTAKKATTWCFWKHLGEEASVFTVHKQNVEGFWFTARFRQFDRGLESMQLSLLRSVCALRVCGRTLTKCRTKICNDSKGRKTACTDLIFSGNFSCCLQYLWKYRKMSECFWLCFDLRKIAFD